MVKSRSPGALVGKLTVNSLVCPCSHIQSTIAILIKKLRHTYHSATGPFLFPRNSVAHPLPPPPSNLQPTPQWDLQHRNRLPGRVTTPCHVVVVVPMRVGVNTASAFSCAHLYGGRKESSFWTTQSVSSLLPFVERYPSPSLLILSLVMGRPFSVAVDISPLP